MRFSEQIEAIAWYVLAEALSNVVKHAAASEVEVSLTQRGRRASGWSSATTDAVSILTGRAGLAWPYLSDRLDTVGGSLTITSSAGLGTSVCVSHPGGGRPGDQKEDPEPVIAREPADA